MMLVRAMRPATVMIALTSPPTVIRYLTAPGRPRRVTARSATATFVPATKPLGGRRRAVQAISRGSPATAGGRGRAWNSARTPTAPRTTASPSARPPRGATRRATTARQASPAMRRIEAELAHGTLVPDTEKFALKSPDRFKEKLAKMIERYPGQPCDELVSSIHDGIRFTFLFPTRGLYGWRDRRDPGA